MDFLKSLWEKFLALLPRLSGWTLIAAALMVAIGITQPTLLMVSLYKISLIPVGAVMGYWIDRGIFNYARPCVYMRRSTIDPDAPPLITDTLLFRAAQFRRAAIIAACIVGVCLGA